MISIFIDENDEIAIDFFIGKDKDGKIYVGDIEEDVKLNVNGNLKIGDNEIEKHFAVFKRPSFGDVVDITNKIFGTEDGQFAFNAMSDKLNKVSKLIKRWSFKDKDGNDIKPDEKQIRALSPKIADYISEKLSQEVGSILG